MTLTTWIRTNKLHVIELLNPSAIDNSDVDFSPQMNLALRREMLYFTTQGILSAVKQQVSIPCIYIDLIILDFSLSLNINRK